MRRIQRLYERDESSNVYRQNREDNARRENYMRTMLAAGNIQGAAQMRDLIVPNPRPSQIPQAEVRPFTQVARPFTDSLGRLTDEAVRTTTERMNAFNDATAREQNILRLIREGNPNLQGRLTQAREVIARTGGIPSARSITVDAQEVPINYDYYYGEDIPEFNIGPYMNPPR